MQFIYFMIFSFIRVIEFGNLNRHISGLGDQSNERRLDQSKRDEYTHTRTHITAAHQSWSLSVLLNFFNNKKFLFSLLIKLRDG